MAQFRALTSPSSPQHSMKALDDLYWISLLYTLAFYWSKKSILVLASLFYPQVWKTDVMSQWYLQAINDKSLIIALMSVGTFPKGILWHLSLSGTGQRSRALRSLQTLTVKDSTPAKCSLRTLLLAAKSWGSTTILSRKHWESGHQNMMLRA